MKTISFIPIPAVGTVPAFDLDPSNRAQVQAFIDRVESYFKCAANHWVQGNNSGDSKYLEFKCRRCDHLRENAERLLLPLHISCSHPGLYPLFHQGDREDQSITQAVASALR